MTKEEAISRQAVIYYIKGYIHEIISESGIDKNEHTNRVLRAIMNGVETMPSVNPQTRWIPIKTRPMTEEEKEEFEIEYPYIYDCPLPDDGQDVFITTCRGNVTVDTFCRDYEGCYFETYCDDGDVVAWMPLPEPYKAESDE